MFVIAHIRGGGEKGISWYNEGRGKNRLNGLDDLIAAAEYLQKDRGYTDNKHIALEGGSNGGMVTAATVNRRPDLFGAVFSKVPVTDMLRFHKFTIGNSWIPEYGYSGDPEDIDFILSYSPLHTVKKVKYPPMIVSTGDNDDRVVPSHTFKLVATLQYMAGQVEGSGPILMNW